MYEDHKYIKKLKSMIFFRKKFKKKQFQNDINYFTTTIGFY